MRERVKVFNFVSGQGETVVGSTQEESYQRVARLRRRQCGPGVPVRNRAARHRATHHDLCLVPRGQGMRIETARRGPAAAGRNRI
jgi:hypothetical protein